MNKNALKEWDKKENNLKFLEMISDIEPVKAGLSSEEMVQLLRKGESEALMPHQTND